MIKIEPIKAFSDNYIWLLSTNEGSVIIDPGDFSPVSKYTKELGIDIDGVLITHHHFDHTGGIKDLLLQNNIPIFGPKNNINEINKVVGDGDKINFIGLEFVVIEVPGHTLDHIAYFCENNGEPFLFCGDTLFAGGCGRVFEGTFDQMFSSLEKIKKLPPNTKIYCAHEYTQQNLKFALEVEPNNESLLTRYKETKELRLRDEITLPSTISLELKTNPFLRCNEKTIHESILNKYNISGNDPQIFKAVRTWKDSF